MIRLLFILGICLSTEASPDVDVVGVLTDAEAGYDQAAYDECLDSAEERDCDE